MKAFARLATWSFWDTLLILSWLSGLALVALLMVLMALHVNPNIYLERVVPLLGVGFLWLSVGRLIMVGAPSPQYWVTYAGVGQGLGSIVSLANHKVGRSWGAVVTEHALLGCAMALLLMGGHLIKYGCQKRRAGGGGAGGAGGAGKHIDTGAFISELLARQQKTMQ
jgi:hypothetical protein